MPDLVDEIRVPLHELQADVDYLIGRVIADASCASTIAASIKGKLTAIEAAILTRAEPQTASSDDLEDLVARFSKALLAKLKLARANGRSGWEFDDWEEHCQAGLLRHLAKGDPRDVAAYCAFMWHHGWATKAADRQSQAESVLVPKPALDWLFGVGLGPDGKSFDDDQDAEERTPRKYSRRYWWRSKFSSMIPALTRLERR